MCRRQGCRDPADLAEARQRILLRLYAMTQRHADLAIENGDAFARAAARWELSDLARERRRREVPLDRATATSALERWSTQAAEDLAAKLEGERVLEEARGVFEAHLAHYRRVAVRSGRGRLAGQHVAAWFMLRVQGKPATEVAVALGVEAMAGGGRAVVWQWAKRGRDLVLRVADADPDHERARIIRAAAGAPDATPENDRTSAG